MTIQLGGDHSNFDPLKHDNKQPDEYQNRLENCRLDLESLLSQVEKTTNILEKMEHLKNLKGKIKPASAFLTQDAEVSKQQIVMDAFIETFEKAQKTIKNFDKRQANLKQWEPQLTDVQSILALIKKCSPTEFKDLRALCYALGNQTLFEEACVLSSTIVDSISYPKIVSNIFLDKVTANSSQEDYEAWYPPVAQAWAAKGLENLQKTACSELTSETMQRIGHWKEAFQQCTCWSGLKILESSDQTLHEVAQEISVATLQLGNKPNRDFLIVPTGIKGHTTLLLIKKQANGKLTVVHYNTGLGISLTHARLGRNYQTFVEVNDVPLEDVCDQKGLFDLLESKQSTKIEELYQKIDYLTRNGTVKHYPPEPLFFSFGQARGTCTFSCCMALMRHQMITSSENWQENKVQFRLFRASFISALWKLLPRYSEHKDLYKIAELKILKSNQELLLAQLAADPTKYEIAKQMLDEALQDNSGLLEFNIDTQPTTTSGKFILLRDLSTQVANKWLTEGLSTKADLTLPEFEHAIFMYQIHSSNKKIILNAFSNLSKIKDPKQLVEEFNTTLKRGKYFLCKFPKLGGHLVADFLLTVNSPQQEKLISKLIKLEPTLAANVAQHVFDSNLALSIKIIENLLAQDNIEYLQAAQDLFLSYLGDEKPVKMIRQLILDKFPDKIVRWVTELAKQDEVDEVNLMAGSCVDQFPQKSIEFIQLALKENNDEQFLFISSLAIALAEREKSKELVLKLFEDCLTIGHDNAIRLAYLLADRISSNPEQLQQLVLICIKLKNPEISDLIFFLFDTLVDFHPSLIEPVILELIKNNERVSANRIIEIFIEKQPSQAPVILAQFVHTGLPILNTIKERQAQNIDQSNKKLKRQL